MQVQDEESKEVILKVLRDCYNVLFQGLYVQMQEIQFLQGFQNITSSVKERQHFWLRIELQNIRYQDWNFDVLALVI